MIRWKLPPGVSDQSFIFGLFVLSCIRDHILKVYEYDILRTTVIISPNWQPDIEFGRLKRLLKALLCGKTAAH